MRKRIYNNCQFKIVHGYFKFCNGNADDIYVMVHLLDHYIYAFGISSN